MAIFDKYNAFLREEDCRKLEVGKIDWESMLIAKCLQINDLIGKIRYQSQYLQCDDPDSDYIISLKKSLVDARKELADLLNLMSEHDFCSRIESLANEVKYWEEYELTSEEKAHNEKILKDNSIIGRSQDECLPEPWRSELRKQAEGLEYKEPFPKQYPWSDIALSMLKHPKSVKFDYDKCQYCGDSRIGLLFSSPKWTWNNLLGKSGWISICMNCKRQSELKIWLRN